MSRGPIAYDAIGEMIRGVAHAANVARLTSSSARDGHQTDVTAFTTAHANHAAFCNAASEMGAKRLFDVPRQTPPRAALEEIVEVFGDDPLQRRARDLMVTHRGQRPLIHDRVDCKRRAATKVV